jgi:hypothetical protein
MAWEKRGRKKFYYRSYRKNGRVQKMCFGSGQRAQQAYEEDLRKQEAKERERATRKEIQALDQQTNSIRDMTRTIANAHLLLGGYHQHHRGEWRKRRIHNIIHKGEITMVPQIGGNVSIEELERLLQRVMTGDENSLPAIRSLLDKAPAIWQDLFSITKRIESAWIQTIAKQDLIAKEILERQVADLKRTLQVECSSPLEFLVVETITTTFLAYKQAELSAAQTLQRNNGMALTQTQQQHLSSCLKRYLSTIKELARIRQLLTPRNTTVLNIANQQQVNLT